MTAQNRAATDERLRAIAAIIANERSPEELYEFPYSDYDRDRIFAQARKVLAVTEPPPRAVAVASMATAIHADYVARYPEEPPVHHAGPGQPVWRHIANAAYDALFGAHDEHDLRS